MNKAKKMTMTLPAEEYVGSGNLACQGCGANLALRYVLKALGQRTDPLHSGLLLGRHRRTRSLIPA